MLHNRLIGFSEPIDRATALSILSSLPRLPGAFLNSPAPSLPAPNHAPSRYRARSPFTDEQLTAIRAGNCRGVSVEADPRVVRGRDALEAL